MAYDRVKAIPTKVAAAQNLYETISYKETLPYRTNSDGAIAAPRPHALSEKELAAMAAALDVMIQYFRGEQDFMDPSAEPERKKIVIRVGKKEPPDGSAQ